MGPYDLVKPALFALPAETAHNLVSGLLRSIQGTRAESLLASRYRVRDDRLAVDAFDCRFPSPVGVAAGFDKNAHAPGPLAALGFGHVEVGGVTAERQPGNPRPRLFRLSEDDALVNRMGFNNDGADAIGARLDALSLPDVPIGINIGKSKSTPLDDAAADYTYTYEQVADAGDYFVVNVSSPNTPGLRELQDRGPLVEILSELREAGAAPLLVKLSPDLTTDATDDALAVVRDLELDGVIAVNTTTERPASLRSPAQAETGGLSGGPLEHRATERIAYVATQVDVPVVGVGGVSSAEGAYRKLRAGASVVQLYTALVYEGPGLARKINAGLLDLLERDGFDSVEDVIGVDLDA
jgi:dihydroorotate dehydrogenase